MTALLLSPAYQLQVEPVRHVSGIKASISTAFSVRDECRESHGKAGVITGQCARGSLLGLVA